MKAANVVLVIENDRDLSEFSKLPKLIEVISDETEVSLFEMASALHEPYPLDRVYQHRMRLSKEEHAFADYVEDLLSQPFQRQEIKDHGAQWLKSRLRIQEFQRNEGEAAKIIANFAFQIFCQDPDKTDFYLKGGAAEVRVRIFVLDEDISEKSFVSKGA